MPDFASILLASALSGICLTLTLWSIWMSSRQANYVLTMGCGIFVLVLHIVAFWQYGKHPDPLVGQVTLALLGLGFLLVCRAANEYLNIRQSKATLGLVLLSMAVVAVVTAYGYDGVGFIIAYGTVSVLLAITGCGFLLRGNHNHRIMVVVALLSGSCAISFGLCGAVLLWNGQWALGHAPDNWAEQINSVLAVMCMTALGALTISLHHLRAKDALVADSMTDPLTGLMNRRALEDIYGARSLGESVAVAMFDLDHFKKTNDVFGHPIGDQVLKRFADVLRKHQRETVQAFRLGGEEFAMVMSRVDAATAKATAEKIGVAFGTEVVPTPLGPLRSTVSGGLAMGRRAGMPIAELIAKADIALYEAKRDGRNRIIADRAMSIDQAANTQDIQRKRA